MVTQFLFYHRKMAVAWVTTNEPELDPVPASLLTVEDSGKSKPVKYGPKGIAPYTETDK
jgi:hypothetical protein